MREGVETVSENHAIQTALEAFSAVERDEPALIGPFTPARNSTGRPAYGGCSRGLREVQDPAGLAGTEPGIPCSPPGKSGAWTRESSRQAEAEVVIHWHQRGLKPSGERAEMEALASTGSETNFARAQMFYTDTAALLRFLQPPGLAASEPQ